MSKQINLKQYTSDFHVQLRIYDRVTNKGWSLRSALEVEGLVRTNFTPCPTAPRKQPLLQEETPHMSN